MRSLVALSALLLLAFVCIGCAPVHAQIPPGNVTYRSYDDMVSVLQAAPFSASTRDAIVESLRVSMSIYAFTALARDSSIGAPAGAQFTHHSIDLLSAIETIGQTTYPNDYAMNEAFAALFRSLNDAHTAYQKPTAGQSFVLPFKINARLVPEAVATRPQQQAIYLREVASLLAIYEKVYGGSPLANATVNGQGSPTKLTSIDGWEVVYIDGIYAIPFLWSIATDQATSFRVGVTKDAHTRFNLLTSGFTYDVDGPPGYFGYRSLRSYGIPDKSSVTLTVRDPSDQTMYDIVFKWVGIAPTPPAVRGGALQAQLEADPSRKGRLALAGQAFPAFPLAEPLHENPILQGQQLEQHYWSIMTAQHPAAESERIALGLPPVVSSEPASVSAPALDAAVRANGISLEIPREISFKTLDDGTGVLRINTFSPKSIETFLDLLQQGITAHQQQYGGKRLIIDLRANGGGDICLGYAVLRFLFPQLESELFSDAVAGDAPFGRYDIPLSPATRKLAELGLQNQRAFPLNNTCEFMTPCAWVRADTQTVFTDFTWYNPVPARALLRGSTEPVEFSGLFHDDCSHYYAQLAPATVNPGYAPSQVVLAADGMCGSTCSVFSSFIQYNQLAKTVAMGGVVDHSIVPLMTEEGMQMWSFPGGQVLQLGSYQQIASEYGVAPDDPLVPHSYPNGAGQSWTFREIYAWNDTQGEYPLEYLHVPAHFHFGWSTNSTDSAGLYAQLLVEQNIFAEDKCVPGFDEIPCDTPNGQGVQACVNNKLVPGQCMVISCDSGYYLSNYGSAGLLQASCQPCGVGTWRSNATWAIKTVRGVVQDRSYEAQSVCAPCKLVANVTLADGTVTCSGKFTATGVQSDNCPWVYRCEAALDGSKVDKKSLHVALGVLIPLVILFFVLAIYFWKAARTAKGTSEQINRSTGYHAMP